MSDPAPIPPFPWQPPADCTPLFARFREQVDEAILQRIAGLDRGEDFHENLSALRALRDEGPTGARLGSIPREVLQLAEHHEPDPTFPRQSAEARRHHVGRAFACGVLLACEATNRRYAAYGDDATLGKLLASLQAFEPPICLEAAGLLTCFLKQRRSDGNAASAGAFDVGLLYCAVNSGNAVDDATIVAMCKWLSGLWSDPDDDWFLSRDERADRQRRRQEQRRWFSGSSMTPDGYRCWSCLGRELVENEHQGRNPEAVEWIKRIGGIVIEETNSRQLNSDAS